MNWYQKTAKEVIDEWKVDVGEGLTYDRASRHLKTFGPNSLAEQKQETILNIFIRQFKSPLVYILIFAATLVLIIGESVDALVIIAVIIINSIIGTVQEGKAKRSLERLRGLTRHRALVKRDGKELLISSEEVVPGDILILHEGDRIVADCRLVVEESFKVDEAILTGEAYAVSKKIEAINKEELVVGDQKNMAFAGTSVVAGYAEAVVVATGIDSQLGKISKELAETSDLPLPLASKILKITHFLAFIVFVIVIFTLFLGLLRSIEFIEIVSAVIGLAVSVIPEGLPVAVTIVLAGGVWRMAKQKAIVRRMAAVEAMGNADALLVDKTGTITTGQMVIRHISYLGKRLEVTGEGYDPKGKINVGSKVKSEDLRKFLGLCYLSLKADLIKEEYGGWRPTGDSTETAIAVVCRKANLARDKLLKEYKIDFAKSFDSKKRYIEAAFSNSQGKWHVLIGAPEYLSKTLKLDHHLESDYQQMASEGMRVVGAVVFGPGKKKLFAHALFAIEEEIRHQVKASIEEAHKAGFKVVMMTGDFAQTAQAIAKKVGIYRDGDLVITGSEVEKMAEAELEEKTEKVTVFARITPEHKLKIVNAFKNKGHITAMTGDGVNDAPALQAANLGIGFGSGTQVAKDSSDIILVDNNFSTITDAIREGRAIYLTLKEIILYLFSTNLGEVFVIMGALILGLPLPLVAIQIIWLNFVTDGFFDLALAQDTPTKKELTSSKDVNSDNLIDKLMIQRILIMGGTMMIVVLPIFYYFSNVYSLTYARSMALLVLSVIQWFNALNVRSRTRSIMTIPINNMFLIASFIIVFILQFVVIETDIGNRIIHTEPLTFRHWVLAFAVSTSIIWIEEVRKIIVRNRAGD
ncbi:hypothetical protein A2164_02345 [Candidatus Curtissbacteria bacterium RBG_13_35_7]|uniref:Cation-transporting P-type ATPase N-terminal domain-containing protein n=1 Tax=Candidatus Curtissbacteria bacterium RBG_13_35_7 TaxID=1797705 RepID=A0A1F5G437_9BACT|nr:MAG: hypothetical protein A2164_02345 [Candidatus Curtissbacteria bacterium RBG_13_35_7]